MPNRRFGLTVQFLLLIVVGMTLTFFVVAAIISRLATDSLRDGLVKESQTFASLATKPIGDTFVLYKDSGTLRIVQQVEKFTDLDSNIENVAVVDINGNLQFSQEKDREVIVDSTRASSFEPQFVYSEGHLSRIVYPYLEDHGAHRYSLVYDISDEFIEKSVAELQRAVALFATLALFAAIVVTYVLINRLFLRPISLLSRAAIDISKGNLDQKIEPKRNDEIGDLATSVNSMADALKADIRKLKEVDVIKTEFMMIASHNLRTPLTIIQGYLDTLLLSKELPPDLRETLQVVAASGNRLSVFAEDILTVSRLEAGENVMSQRERVDLKDLLGQIGKDFMPLLKEKKLSFETNLGIEPCEVIISRPHIRAAIWNLLDNALKFTTEGKITLQLTHNEQEAHISITDTGEGIAPEEVPKLFTKFHRATSTLQYDHEGTGVGLYITKLIVDQHNGTLAVETKLGQGTTFNLHLPLADKGQDPDELL